MTLGAERKKVFILGGLLLVAALVFWLNRADDAPTASNSQSANRSASTVNPVPAPAATRGATPAPPVISQAPRNRSAARSSQEFKPSLKPRRPEDRIDPMTVDPTLRLDLLAKLRDVRLQGGTRSLFEFSQAPPPKTADVKIVPKAIKNALNTPPTTPAVPAAPVKPPPPPILLKFYGYANPAQKRAFFIEGEEIYIVGEGELIKKRYKVVRIGVNSAVVEDTQFQHQQTLPLEEQPA